MTTKFDASFQGTPWSELADQFGESVTYIANGLAGVSVTGIWRPGEVMQSYLPDGDQDVSFGVFVANAADIASPSTDDTFTIDGVTWAVVIIGEPGGPVVELQLETRSRRAVGRGHFTDR